MVNLLDFSDIHRTLRSSFSKQVCVSKPNLNIGKCDFSAAAPVISNKLPTTIKSFETVATFHSKLKTYLF